MDRDALYLDLFFWSVFFFFWSVFFLAMVLA